jgi:hypothetical protein
MSVSRQWATPLTIGAFALMAVTGVLMFFHLDTGLNKVAHEWLGWVMVAGVGLHAAANWVAFKRHFTQNRSGQVIVAVSLLVLAGSFVSLGDKAEGGGLPPPVVAMRAVLASPLKDMAVLTGRPAEALLADAQKAGFELTDVNQPLQSVTGGEREREGALIRLLFNKNNH